MPSESQNLPAVTYYTPVELVGIYRSFLERGKSNGVVWLRGIYIQRPNQNSQWSAFFDELRDVDTNTSITLKINRQDRQRLNPNSLVQIGGLIELIPFANGIIQIVVAVTRFEIIKDQFVTEQDVKRSEIRIAKTKRGFKNVDAILEDKLFRDEEPKVALVFATTSITMLDFNAGINAAGAKIAFKEVRQSFGNATTLASFLQDIDKQQYDVVALIRGGGSGIESLDDVNVLKTVATMTTPVICAIGHVGEELFLKSIADKVASTPNGLGQYFSEMVERVTAKRNNSRAALIEDVKKQFIKQIDEANKKNKELQEKLAKLTKNQEEATKKHNEQVQALTKAQTEATKQHKEQVEAIQKQHIEQLKKTNKQNEELQKKLGELTKTHTEQMGKLQSQMKAQTEANAKQSKEFNESLKKMQDTNSELNKSLQKLTTQNTQAAKDLQEAKDRTRDLEKQLSEALAKSGSNMWMIIAIIAILAFVAILIFK